MGRLSEESHKDFRRLCAAWGTVWKWGAPYLLRLPMSKKIV